MNLSICLALSCFATATKAFVVPSTLASRPITQLYLENHIADMIDKEMDRLKNFSLWRRSQDEKRNSWKQKEPSLPEGFDFNSAVEFNASPDAGKKIQMRKDKRMARDDPARYCADRCVATGHCEVWEDMFEMGPKEVQEFCLNCVLSDEEEPCDVPDKFLEDAGKESWELLRP